MDSDNKYEQAAQKITNFKTELKELVNKYNFGQIESDNYDGEEIYVNSDRFFVVDGYAWYIQSIDEIIEELF